MPPDFTVNLNFDSAHPIYLQIIDEVKRAVARSMLRPGDKLPSQRELAESARVNPNTVQRAYREMEAMGLVVTRRGEGTFIQEDGVLLRQLKSDMARRAVEDFVQQVVALGLSQSEVIDLVASAYEALRAERVGGVVDGK